MTARPPVVARADYDAARADLLAAEKELTRAHDRVAAARRRLPMVAMDSYVFAGTSGDVTLRDLFGANRELLVYQFMDIGPDRLCPGCTHFTDNVVDLAGLDRVGISWATVSDMPLEQIAAATSEHGWTMPFYSSRGTSFAADCGAEAFLLSAFLRDGDEVFRTYSTTQRGVDHLLFHNNMQDLVVYGREEEWEDSPDGWPQHPTYG